MAPSKMTYNEITIANALCKSVKHGFIKKNREARNMRGEFPS